MERAVEMREIYIVTIGIRNKRTVEFGKGMIFFCVVLTMKLFCPFIFGKFCKNVHIAV